MVQQGKYNFAILKKKKKVYEETASLLCFFCIKLNLLCGLTWLCHRSFFIPQTSSTFFSDKAHAAPTAACSAK